MISHAPPQHSLYVDDADGAYATTLNDVLLHGEEMVGGKSQSVGSERLFKELLNYCIHVKNPIERLIYNPVHRLNLPVAIARFVWMMAGSDRLQDIAFYENRVRYFSDDGIIVPGSSFGQRILRSRPGLNQLTSVINRLKKDTHTRRAAISIYQPEDSARDSKDIPCAFGLFYHVRQNQLQATTVMRSNNAFALLPYNMFEFSLLAELVACEIRIPLGTLTHSVVSMHVYENDYEAARSVCDAYQDHISLERNPVPVMPNSASPLDQVRELVILESLLRHESASINTSNIGQWISKGEDKLVDYWRQFYYILLWYVLNRRREDDCSVIVESIITEPWLSFLSKKTLLN
jgi:hypothetical protein